MNGRGSTDHFLDTRITETLKCCIGELGTARVVCVGDPFEFWAELCQCVDGLVGASRATDPDFPKGTASGKKGFKRHGTTETYFANTANPLSLTSLHPLIFKHLNCLQFPPRRHRNLSSTEDMCDVSKSVRFLAPRAMANSTRYVILIRQIFRHLNLEAFDFEPPAKYFWRMFVLRWLTSRER